MLTTSLQYQQTAGASFLTPNEFRSLQASTRAWSHQAAKALGVSFCDFQNADLDPYLPIYSQTTMGCYLLGLGYKFEPGQGQPARFSGMLVNDTCCYRHDRDEWSQNVKGITNVSLFTKHVRTKNIGAADGGIWWNPFL